MAVDAGPPRASATGGSSTASDDLAGRRAARRRGGRRAAGGGQRGRRAAGLPRRLRGVRLAASRAASCSEGVLTCPACERRYFLPRAGRSLDDERLQLEPVPLLRDGQVREGGAARVSSRNRTQAEVVSALRRLQMREMPEGPQPLEASCDLCGTSMPEDHRHLLQLDERSIVCVCESCWALRSGDAEFRPTGSRVRLAGGLRPARASSGRASGSRSGWRSSCAAPSGVVAFYPSPAGATESRARPRRVGRARARSTRCSRRSSRRPRC